MALAMLLNLVVAALAGHLHPARDGALRARPGGRLERLPHLRDRQHGLLHLPRARDRLPAVGRWRAALLRALAGRGRRRDGWRASRRELAAALRRQGAVPVDKIHLTLAFLGRCRRRARAPASVAAVRSRSPGLRRCALDCVGAFRRRRAWPGRGVGSPPPRRSSRCSRRSARGSRRRDSRSKSARYRPARDARRRKVRGSVAAIAAIEPIEWPAGEVTLVRSETGTGRYTDFRGLAPEGPMGALRDLPACEALPGRVACRLRGTGRVAPRIRVQPMLSRPQALVSSSA